MNVDMLRRHLAGLRVHPHGVQYVIDSALAPPQVLLRSGPQHNLTGDFATSLCTYLDESVQGDVVPRWQIASLSVEHAFLVDLESRGDVLFALNHPLQVPLAITNKRGRRQRIDYTPDAVVITKKSVQVIELKTDGEAAGLVESRPNDWKHTGDGYEYATAKGYFDSIGLQHAVVTSSSLPWIRTRNQQFLARQAAVEPDGTRDNRIIRFVRRHSPAAIEAIVESCSLHDAGPILQLIKDGEIFADIDHALLSSPDSAFVCASLKQAQAAIVGFASIQATAATKATVAFDATGDPRHLDELGFRIRALNGGSAARSSGHTVSRRTLQRWARRLREGGPMALNPEWSKCGRRGPRIASWHGTLLTDCLATARRSGKRPTRTTAYGTYEDALETAARKHRCNEAPVGYSTFCRLWKQRDHCTKDAMARGGRRLANAVEPYGDVDEQIVLADGPFQVAHLDHCLAPAHAKDESGTEGKPWLTILIDDWKGEPLARVMTDKYPSHRTDLALLRDCVRRHGRLPHTIFSDHGSDFMGNVFVGALAAFGVSSLYRPEANPRVGHRVERTFGTFATTVCKGYEGFAFDIPNSRAISKKKHPSKGPKRDLNELRQHTDYLLFEVMPTLIPLDGGDSKHDARIRFEKLYGRQGVPVKADITFRIVTAPPLKEKGSVEPSGAIRVRDNRFYSEALIGTSIDKLDTPPRLEPEDPTVLYYALYGKWHVAKSRDARNSRGRSDASIRAEAECAKRPTAADRAERRRALHSKPKPCWVGKSIKAKRRAQRNACNDDVAIAVSTASPITVLDVLPLPLKI